MSSKAKSPLVHLQAPQGSMVRPFMEWAREWYQAAAAEIAQTSGGRCGVLQSSVLASAAASFAFERFALQRATERGDMSMAKLAMGFGEGARKALQALPGLALKTEGFVDPLAPKQAIQEDPDGSEAVQREMRKVVKLADRRAQAERSWLEAREDPGFNELFGDEEE